MKGEAVGEAEEGRRLGGGGGMEEKKEKLAKEAERPNQKRVERNGRLPQSYERHCVLQKGALGGKRIVQCRLSSSRKAIVRWVRKARKARKEWTKEGREEKRSLSIGTLPPYQIPSPPPLPTNSPPPQKEWRLIKIVKMNRKDEICRHPIVVH